MTLDPTFLRGFTLVLTGFAGAFLVALWVALVVWSYRDMRSRHRDRLVHILAALMVALLNLPGVLVYLILRPARTLEEEYQQTLEEEALLQSIEDQSVCPGCERRIKDDWQVCPTCQTKLRKPCHSCGRLMDLPWNICPYCGTPAPGMRKEGTTMEEALRGLKVEEQPVDQETPQTAESRHAEEVIVVERVEESKLEEEAPGMEPQADAEPEGDGPKDETPEKMETEEQQAES
jgi:RNA polymerase subunit RPABC4/transcription elongation factor Spt4